MSTNTRTIEPRVIAAWLEQRRSAYLADLETLVSLESGTFSAAGVDAVSSWMADRLATLGASIQRHSHEGLGDTIVATFTRQADGPTVVMLGHADTVFDPGFLLDHPFAIEDGIARGPGVGDMKSGLLVGLYALEALQGLSRSDEWLPVARLIFIVNPDEETGSMASSTVIRDVAEDADAALVLEGGRANGDIVSARKGMVHLHARLHGRAAHAGVEPTKGRSATLEAAHKTVALHALNGRWDGVTVNVGVLAGGTRPNIVASEAQMHVDLRSVTSAAQDAAEAAVREILETSTVPDVATDVETTANHRPMEKTAASSALVERYRAAATAVGFEVSDTATGGGSDANTTAGMGVPSIDGLGPVGGNDHTPNEYIELESVVPRTAALALLLVSLPGRD